MTSILPIAIFLQEFAEECQLQPAEMEKEEIGAKAVLEPFVHMCVCVCVCPRALFVYCADFYHEFIQLLAERRTAHACTHDQLHGVGGAQSSY